VRYFVSVKVAIYIEDGVIGSKIWFDASAERGI